ncbi:hypothetical protein JAAARDRAFT_678418 [Jaapia argillacea MUCL 33604]|uniref:Uncharacterized protein n=1 Tax=Jaapia argillacea MUCL 33604 TaxID=933084 RepID=A0A067Q807_9AGAM|nr:hypothetical protein JAAARDRAFT_678418 [Jaapia argillacea MUCL 33604]
MPRSWVQMIVGLLRGTFKQSERTDRVSLHPQHNHANIYLCSRRCRLRDFCCQRCCGQLRPPKFSCLPNHNHANQMVQQVSCEYLDYIDVNFDINFDGATFVACLGVSVNNWSGSSTLVDFAYCRQELTSCSPYDGSHLSGVCFRANEFCDAARSYCDTLQGYFQGSC